MLRKVILCPNPYRDAQLRVAKEAKRVLDEVGCPNVVCLPFRNQEPPYQVRHQMTSLFREAFRQHCRMLLLQTV